jgi:hypothetical protein
MSYGIFIACLKVGRCLTSEMHVHAAGRGAGAEFVRNDIQERVAMQMTGHKTRSVFEQLQHRQRW